MTSIRINKDMNDFGYFLTFIMYSWCYLFLRYFKEFTSKEFRKNIEMTELQLFEEKGEVYTSMEKKLGAPVAVNTYYLYTMGGQLLSEIGEDGRYVREYLYIGGKMLAEYKPDTDKLYYYMNDPIRSTRMITDENGDVVYSAAYGPYGDLQKEFVNTYQPKLKFSGKERDKESDLDYFGARYYSNTMFRFTSVDPVRNRDDAINNPQLWNLYAYCNNNPINMFDPDGKDVQMIHKTYLQVHIILRVIDHKTNKVLANWSFGPYDPNIFNLLWWGNELGQQYNEIDKYIKKHHTEMEILQTNAELDKKLVTIIKNRKKRFENYNLFLNNCATTALEILNTVGINVKSDSIRPDQVFKDFKKYVYSKHSHLNYNYINFVIKNRYSNNEFQFN